MYTYTDTRGNTWRIVPAPPCVPPIHAGQTTWGWLVHITWQEGGATAHQHPNLAEAVAEAIAKRS